MKYKFDGKYHFRFLVTCVNNDSYKCRNLFIRGIPLLFRQQVLFVVFLHKRIHIPMKTYNTVDSIKKFKTPQFTGCSEFRRSILL